MCAAPTGSRRPATRVNTSRRIGIAVVLDGRIRILQLDRRDVHDVARAHVPVQ